MRWLLLLLASWWIVTSDLAHAADAEGVVTTLEQADQGIDERWTKRVRRARRSTSIGVALMVPAAAMVVGGTALALASNDMDLLLGAGLGGMVFGAIALGPLMSGSLHLEHFVRKSGRQISAVPFAVVLGTHALGVMFGIASVVVGSEALFGIALTMGALHIGTAMYWGFRRLKQSKPLVKKAPVARRARVLPMFMPTQHSGAVAGLVGVF